MFCRRYLYQERGVMTGKHAGGVLKWRWQHRPHRWSQIGHVVQGE
jgi:hypothetical protein